MTVDITDVDSWKHCWTPDAQQDEERRRDLVV